MANEKRLIDANALAQKLKKHHDFYIEAWGGFDKLPPDTKARVDEISACWAEVYNEQYCSGAGTCGIRIGKASGLVEWLKQPAED